MCGLDIRSDMELPELTESTSNAIDKSIMISSTATAPLIVRSTLRNRFPAPFEIGGVANFRRLEPPLHGSEFVADGIARVTTNGAGSEILVEHVLEADRALLSHIVVDQAIPRSLAERGAMVLHATCVAKNGRGFGFLGSTGTGKSTLALSFVRDGAQLVADDCLVLRARGDHLDALPSYSSGRLRTDSLIALDFENQSLPASPGKRRIPAMAYSGAVEMAALFVLERTDDDAAQERNAPIVTRLLGVNALWALAVHSFASSGVESTTAIAALMLLQPVVDRIAVFALMYRSGFDELQNVRDEVLRCLRLVDPVGLV